MALARAADGTANLHIWREGEEYLRQKGPMFLKQWNNLVFAMRPGPPLANTRYVDLSTAPLGFPDNTFDAVYAYHVFEHLTPSQGECCAQQLFGVLRPGGICRLSVPDLETACRHYLDALHAAVDRSTRQALVRYRWAVMEIFEQMVRDHSGGMMSEAIERGEYDEAQLRELFGDMLRPLVASARTINSGDGGGSRERRSVQPPRPSTAPAVLRRIYRKARTVVGQSSPWVISRRATDPRFTKEAVRWMYDRLSLRLLLEQAGFQDVHQVDHVTSSIPGWSAYDFDRASDDDYPLDPSVYVEGTKPER